MPTRAEQKRRARVRRVWLWPLWSAQVSIDDAWKRWEDAVNAGKVDPDGHSVSRRTVARDWELFDKGWAPSGIAGFDTSGKNGRLSDDPQSPNASLVDAAAEWAATVLRNPSAPHLLDGLVVTHIGTARALAKSADDGISTVSAQREMGRHLEKLLDRVLAKAGPDREESPTDVLDRLSSELKK